MHEALGSIPNTTKRTGKRRERDGGREEKMDRRLCRAKEDLQIQIST
jgi:hypothetical protein